jgi:hypothetical protein
MLGRPCCRGRRRMLRRPRRGRWQRVFGRSRCGRRRRSGTSCSRGRRRRLWRRGGGRRFGRRSDRWLGWRSGWLLGFGRLSQFDTPQRKPVALCRRIAVRNTGLSFLQRNDSRHNGACQKQAVDLVHSDCPIANPANASGREGLAEYGAALRLQFQRGIRRKLASAIERTTGQVVHINFNVARCNTCGEAPQPTAALFDQLIHASQRARRTLRLAVTPGPRAERRRGSRCGTKPAAIELKRPVRYTGRGPSRLGNRGAEPTLLPLPRGLRALENSL